MEVSTGGALHDSSGFYYRPTVIAGALQQDEIVQRGHRPVGPKADTALTFKLDHSRGAAHCQLVHSSLTKLLLQLCLEATMLENLATDWRWNEMLS